MTKPFLNKTHSRFRQDEIVFEGFKLASIDFLFQYIRFMCCVFA